MTLEIPFAILQFLLSFQWQARASPVHCLQDWQTQYRQLQRKGMRGHLFKSQTCLRFPYSSCFHFTSCISHHDYCYKAPQRGDLTNRAYFLTLLGPGTWKSEIKVLDILFSPKTFLHGLQMCLSHGLSSESLILRRRLNMSYSTSCIIIRIFEDSHLYTR